MLKFKKLKLKNFMSFGKLETIINLDENNLTLILGENYDKNDPEDNKNGCGKSVIPQALHYAIFGDSIDNKIKKSNLINKINGKNMEVSLLFEKDDKEYLIERGRSPEYLKFKVDGIEDETQGENKDTQKEIENVLGLSEDMFSQTILLTTTVDSILNQPVSIQRSIIEQLLGVTILSNKAEKLKEFVKENKKIISNEETRITTIISSNKVMKENNERHIKELEKLSSNFIEEKNEKISKLRNGIQKLEEIDISKELDNFKDNEKIKKYNDDVVNKLNSLKELKDKLKDNLDKQQKIRNNINDLSKVNIEDELKKFEEIENIKKKEEFVKTAKIKLDSDIKEYSSNEDKILKYKNNINSIDKSLEDISNNICPTCKQQLHGNDNLKNDLIKKKEEVQNSIFELKNSNKNLSDEINNIQESISLIDLSKPKTYYENISDVYEHKNKLEQFNTSLDDLKNNIKELESKIKDISVSESDIKEYKKTFYKNIDDAYKHKNNLDNFKSILKTEEEKQNPYISQIESLKDLKLVEIDETLLNNKKDDLNHQEFLLKLLSDKNSYIRKKIVEENLEYLNQELKKYLIQVGSLHNVRINSDLSTTIEKNGADYDYANLSRGEQTRVIFALAFSFRNLFELLNGDCNLMFIDELMDNGLDSAGIKLTYEILKIFKNKNIFIISHRPELRERCENQMIVRMEDQFSTIIS